MKIYLCLSNYNRQFLSDKINIISSQSLKMSYLSSNEKIPSAFVTYVLITIAADSVLYILIPVLVDFIFLSLKMFYLHESKYQSYSMFLYILIIGDFFDCVLHYNMTLLSGQLDESVQRYDE